MVFTFHPKNECPTLLDIWINYTFDKKALALLAQVDASIIDDMMASQPVEEVKAKEVLFHLSNILKKDLSLDTVHVVLKRQVNKSELALLMQEIDAEYHAARQGMEGLAQGTTWHQFITKRQENIANAFKALSETYGDDVALQVMLQWKEESTGNTNP